MTDRQVAERLRSYLYGRPVYGRDKNTADNARAADTLRIVRAYLREHDPTPLTEEWIKKALPPTGSRVSGYRDSAEYSTAIGRLSWIGWESGLCLYFFGEGVHWWNMTRGQFRMMAMSIGLELKEDEE